MSTLAITPRLFQLPELIQTEGDGEPVKGETFLFVDTVIRTKTHAISCAESVPLPLEKRLLRNLGAEAPFIEGLERRMNELLAQKESIKELRRKAFPNDKRVGCPAALDKIKQLLSLTPYLPEWHWEGPIEGHTTTHVRDFIAQKIGLEVPHEEREEA